MIDIVNKQDFKDFIFKGNLCIVSWSPKDITEDVVSCNREGVYLKKSMTYDEVVSELIHVRYSNNDEISILSNAVEDSSSAEYKEYVRWCDAVKVEAKKYLGLEIDELAVAKSNKIKEINEYDASDNVNSFTYNGVPMWIGLELRKNITHDINVLKAKNIEEFTFWNNGTTLTFPIAVLENLLVEIEIYALNCFNVTAQHKANVEALETIEEVNAYDYTTGYPNKLEL